MEKKIINTDKAPAAVGPYVQAIQKGNMLYASGQLGLVPETGAVSYTHLDVYKRQLHCKAADLCVFYCGILSELRGDCDDWTLFVWNSFWNINGSDFQENEVQRKGGSFCHGASQLQNAWGKKCGAFALG